MKLCSLPRIKCFQISLQRGLWFYRLVSGFLSTFYLWTFPINIENSVKTKAFFWLVWWFDLSQHLSPTQPLSHSLHWDGGENWRCEKTHCLRQNHLKRESKSFMHRQSKTRIVVTTFHGQGGFQQSPGKPDCIVFNTHLGRQEGLWCPLFLLLPPDLYTEHEVSWYGAFLGSFWVCSPVCASSQLLVHPKPPCW